MDANTPVITTEAAEQAVIRAILEQQEISGEPPVSVNAATCPFADLPGFDSLRAISAMMSIEEALQRKLMPSGEPFHSLTKNRNPTVREIAQAIYESIDEGV
jgi:acyl carrier protein